MLNNCLTHSHTSRTITSSQYHPRETRSFIGQPNLYKKSFIGFIDLESDSYYTWKWSKRFADSFHIEAAKWLQANHFHIRYENEANILLIRFTSNKLFLFLFFPFLSFVILYTTYIYVYRRKNETNHPFCLFSFFSSIMYIPRTDWTSPFCKLSFFSSTIISLVRSLYIHHTKSLFFLGGYSISRIQLLGLPINSTIHYNEDWINRFPGPFDFQINRLFLQFSYYIWSWNKRFADSF